jgi:hypothetical protein
MDVSIFSPSLFQKSNVTTSYTSLLFFKRSPQAFARVLCLSFVQNLLPSGLCPVYILPKSNIRTFMLCCLLSKTYRTRAMSDRSGPLKRKLTNEYVGLLSLLSLLFKLKSTFEICSVSLLPKYESIHSCSYALPQKMTGNT